jgi:ribosomal protein S27AE
MVLPRERATHARLGIGSLPQSDELMNEKRRCPRCSGFLLKVDSQYASHYECLNCGFSDEPAGERVGRPTMGPQLPQLRRDD